MQILALGPLPPPFGGTTVSFAEFLKFIQKIPVKIAVINTNYRSQATVLRKVNFTIASWVRLLRLLPYADIITLHASTRRFVLYGSILYLVSCLARKPVILRAFGGSLDLYFLSSKPFTKLMFKGAFANNLILLQTKQLVTYFQKIFPKAKIEWLPNSRTLKAFSNNHDLRNGRFVFVGDVSESKGILNILQVLKNHAGQGIRIDVIGRIGRGVSEEDLYDTPGLEYLGVLSPDEVIERIGHYEALILPTHFPGEGYPGVILEAYSQGTPVIVTRWRAIPEIVEDGETGLLIEPNDSGQLHQALIRIRSDAALRRRMSRSALHYVQRFDSKYWHNVKWLDWLKSTLQDAQSS